MVEFCIHIHAGTGLPALVTEDVSRAVTNGIMYAQSSMVSDNGNVKLTAESYIHEKARWREYVNFKAITKDGGFPKLKLIDDVSTWRIGNIEDLQWLEHWWLVYYRCFEPVFEWPFEKNP